jgi:hypothetical protein
MVKRKKAQKDKQRYTKHTCTYKTKDRVTRTPQNHTMKGKRKITLITVELYHLPYMKNIRLHTVDIKLTKYTLVLCVCRSLFVFFFLFLLAIVFSVLLLAIVFSVLLPLAIVLSVLLLAIVLSV